MKKFLTVETPRQIMELMVNTFPDETAHAVHYPGTPGEGILPVLHETRDDGYRWVLCLDYDGVMDYLVYDSFTGSMTHEVDSPGCTLVTSCSKSFPRQKEVPQKRKNTQGKLVYHLELCFYREGVGMDRDGNLILYRKLLP